MDDAADGDRKGTRLIGLAASVFFMPKNGRHVTRKHNLVNR